MERWKKILALGILLALALLCIVYALADPSSSILFPKCPVKLLTGMQCPSCGVQRALHSLLQGRLLEALSYNYWFILSIPYFLLVALSTLFKTRPFMARIYRIVTHKGVIYAYIVLFFLWWILRNILEL